MSNPRDSLDVLVVAPHPDDAEISVGGDNHHISAAGTLSRRSGADRR